MLVLFIKKLLCMRNDIFRCQVEGVVVGLLSHISSYLSAFLRAPRNIISYNGGVHVVQRVGIRRHISCPCLGPVVLQDKVVSAFPLQTFPPSSVVLESSHLAKLVCIPE